jgi:hypothetical protein
LPPSRINETGESPALDDVCDESKKPAKSSESRKVRARGAAGFAVFVVFAVSRYHDLQCDKSITSGTARGLKF